MSLTGLFTKIKYRDPTVMPAWEVLRMVTIEGAQAVGLGDEIGSLEEGKQAEKLGGHRFSALNIRKKAMEGRMGMLAKGCSANKS